MRGSVEILFDVNYFYNFFIYVIHYQFNFYFLDLIKVFSCPEYFSKLLLTTENVASAIFRLLYLILSKVKCSCLLYFPFILSLFLTLKCIIESAFISPLINS